MPIYDYECKTCGAVQEVRHGFGENHTDACSACGGEMRRRLSATGIVFKGSGFYITDSRKSGGSASSSTSSSTASASESKPAATSTAESTSAPAAETKKPSTTSDAA